MKAAAQRFDGPGYGAFVLSLDFELHWGVRDHEPANGAYRQNLLGAREAIPRLLGLFAQYEIPATWAIVGFLFAQSREERERFEPKIRPTYWERTLDPYVESVGGGERDDPLHYAPTLIEQIRSYPQQEIATHTFSHYYCREPGQTLESFKADLQSAVAIAAARGIRLRSIVFPRNQINPEYHRAVLDAGITCYRGTEPGWMHHGVAHEERTFALRLARAGDSYVDISGSRIASWGEVIEPSGLCNIRASRFLWPYKPSLKGLQEKRLERITKQLNLAALEDGIFHLWFHPHNFGIHLEENLDTLERILQTFASARQRYGMRALCMSEAADLVRGDRIRPTENVKFIPTKMRKESVPA